MAVCYDGLTALPELVASGSIISRVRKQVNMCHAHTLLSSATAGSELAQSLVAVRNALTASAVPSPTIVSENFCKNSTGTC